jgi:Protein of unknown function (DUF2924)
MVRKASGPAGLSARPVDTLSERVRKQIEELPNWPRTKLVERWISIYGHPPPKFIKRPFLERAVAWHIQAKVYGGLKPATRNYLLKVAEEDRKRGIAGIQRRAAGDVAPPNKYPTLKPGMRLVREHRGRSHVVDVLDEGFAYDGKVYESLSAVAKVITGTSWSGPRFFSP